MRFDQRLLWAWGVATLVHVGAAVAQGPLPPAAPPADPVQFQPAAPLTPIGAAVPAAPSPTMLTSGTAPVNTTPTPQPPTAPAPQPPQFVATQPAPPPVATAPVATAPVAAAHVATVPVTSGTVPVLEVKQLLPDSVVPGQTVAAEVTVTNTGGRTADNVVLAGWWTAGYDLTEATVVATPGTNGRQTWGLGAIPAGETRTVKVKLTPKAGVAATEFRSGFDATFSSATDTRAVKVLKPELQVAVEGSDTAFVGQAHPLTLKVKNPSAAGLEKVFVKVELPDSLAHPKGTSLESEIAVLGGGSTESIPLNLTAVRAGVGRVKVRVSSPGCDTRMALTSP